MKKRGKNSSIVKSENNLVINNKSQVAIFIIVAMLLVAIIIFAVIINNIINNENDPAILKPDVENIKDAIISCAESNTKNALRTIGIQGGYFEKPRLNYDIGWAFIPYYYYKGSYLMPEKVTIEKELSKYVDYNIKDCINKIKFKSYEIEYTESKTDTRISKGRADFRIDMPINIIKGDNVIKVELKQHPVIYNSSLNEIIEVATFITTSHSDNSELMCVNCVLELAKERKLYVDFIDFPKAEKTTLVVLSENVTSDEPYMFEFLNGY